MPETKPLLLITINGGTVAEWALLVLVLIWSTSTALEAYQMYLNWRIRKKKGGA